MWKNTITILKIKVLNVFFDDWKINFTKNSPFKRLTVTNKTNIFFYVLYLNSLRNDVKLYTKIWLEMSDFQIKQEQDERDNKIVMLLYA